MLVLKLFWYRVPEGDIFSSPTHSYASVQTHTHTTHTHTQQHTQQNTHTQQPGFRAISPLQYPHTHNLKQEHL